MGVALAVVGLMFAGAAGFIIAGVYMLCGLPWALISFGVALFVAAAALRSGLTHG